MEIYNNLKNMNNVPKLENFKIISLLGKGGFSQVKKVKYYNQNIIYKEKNTECYLSMKEMSKKRIIQYNCIENIFHERDILLNLYNNSIVNMYCTFQDENNIYMIMDYLAGKDLRHLMKNNKKRKFKEKEIVFFAACIITGLEYIHSHNIIHRDIKPENLLFDSKYFLKIADFGIAIKNDSKLKNDNLGTFNYIAPERVGYFQNINNYKYSFESDFYSLGVILYELCMGKRPFDTCKNKNELLEKFSNINYIKINSDFYSQNLCDLINKLLIFNPCERIGYNNIEEIKSHPIFYKFPWKNLIYQTMKSPVLEDNNDIILISKENILIDGGEENKEDSISLNEKDQLKFKDYPCIHKLNISDIFRPKILINGNRNNSKNNSFKMALTTNKNQRKFESLKDIKSSINNKFLNWKKILISNNNNNNELLLDKNTIFKKNLFNNNLILPKIGGKLYKSISNISIKKHHKVAENNKLNNKSISLLVKEDCLNDNLNIKKSRYGNNKSRNDKLINSPILKRASNKLKTIFQI